MPLPCQVLWKNEVFLFKYSIKFDKKNIFIKCDTSKISSLWSTCHDIFFHKETGNYHPCLGFLS